MTIKLPVRATMSDLVIALATAIITTVGRGYAQDFCQWLATEVTKQLGDN